MTNTAHPSAAIPEAERVHRKSVFWTGIAVFVATSVMAVLVHGLWLGASYTGLMGDVWRSQTDLLAKSWIMHSTTVVYGFVFAYLFARGYRGGGWKEGMWFGFVSYFFTGFQAVFHAYATYPLPLDLVLKWFVGGLLVSLLAGALAGLVYRPRS